MAYQRGEARHCAKLTEPEVIAMREDRKVLCACGRPPSYAALGEKYGVSAVAAFKICTGKDWKHVNEDAA